MKVEIHKLFNLLKSFIINYEMKQIVNKGQNTQNKLIKKDLPK